MAPGRRARFLTPSFIVILCLQSHVESGAQNQPRAFQESMLYKTPLGASYPSVPTIKQMTDNVAGLGRVAVLNQQLPPSSGIKDAATLYSIHTRQQSVLGIKFEPKANSEGHHIDLAALRKIDFDPIKRRTIIMIPGYLSSRRDPWIEEAIDTWLELEDVNIITISWSSATIYSGAVADTPLLGRQLTVLLYYLASLNGASFQDQNFLDGIHVIGHSLGAQTAGFLGDDFGGRIGRITGLDPAGPSFDNRDPTLRLDPSDAQLVDALHTNAGQFRALNAAIGVVPQTGLSFFDGLTGSSGLVKSLIGDYEKYEAMSFGINLNVGHLDYYANGGKRQPGCYIPPMICDHVRSRDIYLALLERELVFKRAAAASQAPTVRNPMLAFKANDYSDYKNGNSLQDYCPRSIDEPTGRARDGSQLAPCGVPFDLVTPVKKLIPKLKRVHGISFNKSDTNRPALFFKTLASSPYVGDQYLLTLKLHKPQNWHESCNLVIDIDRRGQERVTSINLDGTDLLNSRVASKDPEHSTLAIPFVLPPSKLSSAPRRTTSDTSSLPVWLPAQITMSVMNNKLTERLSSMWSHSLYKIFGSESAAYSAASDPQQQPGWKRHPYISDRLARSSSATPSPAFASERSDPECSLRLVSVAARPLTGELSHMSLLYDNIDRNIKSVKALDESHYKQLVTSGYLDGLLLTPSDRLVLSMMGAYVK